MIAHDYCARPRCRAAFVPEAHQGRRQRYCSAECRRAADTEHKQVIARIASLERSLRLARLDLATFGREADEPDDWCGCDAYATPHPYQPDRRVHEGKPCPTDRVDPMTKETIG